eukprot:TRINITY_DN1991_c0_g1_i1.p1 TRINITY_DN1991_c0_g1~~TRINITY_DN1991_c0_g1_i1.p1  ORF type:complete len:388 (-),score=40.66 TRINITY_DN1991_c0_g1_i1:157-1275(-)
MGLTKLASITSHLVVAIVLAARSKFEEDDMETRATFKPMDEVRFLEGGLAARNPKAKKTSVGMTGYKKGDTGTIRKEVRRGVYAVCVGVAQETLASKMGITRRTMKPSGAGTASFGQPMDRRGTTCPGGEVEVEASKLELANKMSSWDADTETMQEVEVDRFKANDRVKILIGGQTPKGPWSPGTEGIIMQALRRKDGTTSHNYKVCVLGEVKRGITGTKCTGLVERTFPASQLQKVGAAGKSAPKKSRSDSRMSQVFPPDSQASGVSRSDSYASVLSRSDSASSSLSRSDSMESMLSRGDTRGSDMSWGGSQRSISSSRSNSRAPQDNSWGGSQRSISSSRSNSRAPQKAKSASQIHSQKAKRSSSARSWG